MDNELTQNQVSEEESSTDQDGIEIFNKLNEKLSKAVNMAGFKQATAVQIETFEYALNGRDLFVSAETGSGKTAAYLLPIFEKLLNSETDSTLALIIVPTRELAQQVLAEAQSLSRYTDLTTGQIVGGADIKEQNKIVKYPPQLLIATPGRLLSLLSEDQFDISKVETLILDEADRLLDMGFSDEINSIAAYCENRNQTQLYSATLANKSLKGFAGNLLTEPKVLFLNKLIDSHDSIRQQVIFSDDNNNKFKQIYWLLNNEEYRQCLIFCNSKQQANQLCGLLQYNKFSSGIIHGDREQSQRNYVMDKLRKGEIRTLVATDIAARGLDVKGIDLVINFDVPRKGEIYIHRIGRTGRGGDSGLSISLVCASEFNLMSGIERFLKQSFERRRIKSVITAFNGPKKLKASGKAAGTKKNKLKKKATKEVEAKKAAKVKKAKAKKKRSRHS